MAINQVQMQSGLSIGEITQQYGNDEQCERWQPPGDRMVMHDRPIGVDDIRRFSAVAIGYGSVSGVAIKTVVTAGTIFASTKLALTTWLLSRHLLNQAKNNASTLELKRQLGASRRTA